MNSLVTEPISGIVLPSLVLLVNTLNEKITNLRTCFQSELVDDRTIIALTRFMPRFKQQTRRHVVLADLRISAFKMELLGRRLCIGVRESGR
jgi:hypothetical protein